MLSCIIVKYECGECCSVLYFAGQVNEMEKIVEQGLLYDFYGELLTDHQKKVYEEAVYDDMSLSEIAEDIGISRQGVHDLIKRCDKILHDYEHKLHLVEKFTRIKESVREINQISEQAITENSELQRIRQLSDDILREL